MVDGIGRGAGILNGHGATVTATSRFGTAPCEGSRWACAAERRALESPGLNVTRNAAGGIALRSRECRVERNVVTDNGYGHGIFVGGVEPVPHRRQPGRRSARRRHRGVPLPGARDRAQHGHRQPAGGHPAGRHRRSSGSTRNTVYGNAGPGIWLSTARPRTEVSRTRSPQTAQGSRSPSGARQPHRAQLGFRQPRGGHPAGRDRHGNPVAGNLVVLSGEDGIRLAESPAARVERQLRPRQPRATESSSAPPARLRSRTRRATTATTASTLRAAGSRCRRTSPSTTPTSASRRAQTRRHQGSECCSRAGGECTIGCRSSIPVAAKRRGGKGGACRPCRARDTIQSRKPSACAIESAVIRRAQPGGVHHGPATATDTMLDGVSSALCCRVSESLWSARPLPYR